MLLTLLAVLASFGTSAQAGQAVMKMMPANGVYLNSDGAPILQLLQSAEQSVDIEIYTMQDQQIRALLRNALARNVRVRILKDPNPLGEKCDIFVPLEAQIATGEESSADCLDQRKLVSEVRAAGGTFAPFDKKSLCPNGGGKDGQSCFEHGKIAIADKQVAVISTGNLDATNLCIASENPSRCNRDYSLIENDPTVVGTLENLFESDLRGNSYDVRTLIPASLDHLLIVSPYSLQALVDFINSAESSIDLETQYLNDPELNGALIAAAKRGVQVNLTVASVCAFGTPSASEVKQTQKIYTAFDNAGVSSAMFNAANQINGHAGYMHAKVIVVDGTRAWLGSQNGSTTSLTENREYGLIFDNPAWVQKILSTARADHSSSDSETWNQSLTCTKDGGALDRKIPDPNATGSRPRRHPRKPPHPSGA